MKNLNEIYEIIKQFKATTSASNSEAHIILNTLIDKMDSFEKETKQTDSPLTKREVEILTLVAKGFTNKEVASAFSISHKTIEFHLKNIYQKSETSGRSEAISQAISRGWITP